MATEHTIVALTTPAGKSSVAVLRLSGANVADIALLLLKKKLQPRIATLSYFYDETDEAIDEGIAILFPAPHSFTGESVLELQGHGNPLLISQLKLPLHRFARAVPRPGEFSERAFLNGKMDLVQAEAIADLIEAGSVRASRSAMQSLQGRFSELIHQLVEALVYLRTYLEAALDFSEEDIDVLHDADFALQLARLVEQVHTILKNAEQGQLLREGVRVVIAGKPNAGKSSLLNALVDEDVAIVTDVPGTTRDVLKREIYLDGLPLHIIDTAGLHQTSDKVEQEGIRRAHREFERADLILYVADVSQEQHQRDFLKVTIPIIYVANKIDLATARLPTQEHSPTVAVSALTGEGMQALKQCIKDTVGFHPEENDGIFLARARHMRALEQSRDHLSRAQHHFTIHDSLELIAEELRLTQLCLNEITGEFTADDLLSKIFSSFCIGK